MPTKPKLVLTKDPAARKDWSWNWGDDPDDGPGFLLEGETIESATVVLADDAPTGLTVEQPPVVDDTTVRVWISGGTLSFRYELVCHVVTTQGREDEKTIGITIANR